MCHKIGDAVRLRVGSDLRGLVDPWDEATGTVSAVFDDMDPPRINVLYGDAGPLVSTVIAAEFVSDLDFASAPF